MKKINIAKHKVAVAENNNDFYTGMSSGNHDVMVFPFGTSGKKSMTMNPKGKAPLKKPLGYKGYTNGKLTDQGVAYPGEDFMVDGDTVVEHKLAKAQLGGGFMGSYNPMVGGTTYGYSKRLPVPEVMMPAPTEPIYGTTAIPGVNIPSYGKEVKLPSSPNDAITWGSNNQSSKPSDESSWDFTPKQNNVKDIKFPWENTPIKSKTPAPLQEVKLASKPNDLLTWNPEGQFVKSTPRNTKAPELLDYLPKSDFVSPRDDLSLPKAPGPKYSQVSSTPKRGPRGSDQYKSGWAGDISNMTPGDIVQNLPLNATYNLGKYLLTKPVNEAPIYNEYANRALGIKQHLTAASDRMPIRIQDKAAKQFINDNVGSASGRIANLLQQDANTENTYREDAFATQLKNNEYASQFADTLMGAGAARAAEKLRVLLANQEHDAKHDDYLGHAVREYDNNLQNLGKNMNQARQNEIALNTLNSTKGGVFQADKYGRISFTDAGREYWLSKGVTDVNEAQRLQLEKDKEAARLAKEAEDAKKEKYSKPAAGQVMGQPYVDERGIKHNVDGSVIPGQVEDPNYWQPIGIKATGGYTNRVKAYLKMIN